MNQWIYIDIPEDKYEKLLNNIKKEFNTKRGFKDGLEKV